MRLKGWPIVLAVTLGAVAWALTLRWLAPRPVEALGIDEVAVRRAAAREVIDRLPVDVLERWAQELELTPRRVDALGILPWDGLDVVVARGEPADAAAFWDMALARTARTGVRLVWFPGTAGAHAIPALGLRFGPPTGSPVGARATLPLPMLDGVGAVELDGAGPLIEVGSPALRLLEDERHGVYAALVPVGRGEVVVVNAPGLTTLRGLKQGDNALLLAALFRRDGAQGRVGILRARETGRELLITSMDRALEAARREARRVRHQAPLVSLWSLVVANPSCLVLVQLLLAALVHLLGAGRDLEAPAAPPAPAADGRVLGGLASLYRSSPWGARVLLPVAHAEFRLRLRRLLGAGPEAEPEELEALLAKRAPELAGRFVGIASLVQSELAKGAVDRYAFSVLVGKMESLLREVAR